MARRRPLSRERSLSRAKPFRRSNARFLILREGQKTEQDYLEYVRGAVQGPILKIEKEQGDPLRLVEHAVKKKKEANDRARREKDENLAYDQVWCVIDVDDHKRLPEARRLAAKEGVRLAISNPCFELWILLHFADQHAHISSSGLQAALKRYFPDYDKSVACDRLRGRYQAARDRARKLDRQHERNGLPPGSNPSTSVWQLIDALQDAAAKSGTRRGVKP